MTWIKADHTFGTHSALFFVTRKHMLMESQLFEMLRLHGNQNTPELLEAAVLDLIHKCRPELKGCVVWHMGYEASEGRWEFSVSHASLPSTVLYERPKALPLDPALEREYAEVGA
jgi:hypothetical protein